MSVPSLPDRARLSLQIVLSELLALRVYCQRQPCFSTYAGIYSRMLGLHEGHRGIAEQKVTERGHHDIVSREEYESTGRADTRRRLLARTNAEIGQLCNHMAEALKSLVDQHFSERGEQRKKAGADLAAKSLLDAAPWGGMAWLSPDELKDQNPAIRDRAFWALHAWGLPVYEPRTEGTEDRDPYLPSEATEVPLEVGKWPNLPVWRIRQDGMIRQETGAQWHENLTRLAYLEELRGVAGEIEGHFAAFDEFPQAEARVGRKQLPTIEEVARQLLNEYSDPGPPRSRQRKEVLDIGVRNYMVKGRSDLNEAPKLFHGALSRALARQLKMRGPAN